MAPGSRCGLLVVGLLSLLLATQALAYYETPISTNFYDESCPKLRKTIKKAFNNEVKKDWRIGASLLRMMFHDCFVQGCDGSVLLEDTPTFTGERQALSNFLSIRGFEALDRIKASVEHVCPGVVSCADTLAVVARESVLVSGGPSWPVELGRRDSLTASKELADSDLPTAISDVSTITALFAKKGLDQTDTVALLGAHTFGKAQCPTFRSRLYNFNGGTGPDPTLDAKYLPYLRAKCPEGGSNTTTVDLDQATPTTFDNSFYKNLLHQRGLLVADQTFLNGGDWNAAYAVKTFATKQSDFFQKFAWAMVKMGRITPLTGTQGEIRTKCSVRNAKSRY